MICIIEKLSIRNILIYTFGDLNVKKHRSTNPLCKTSRGAVGTFTDSKGVTAPDDPTGG